MSPLSSDFFFFLNMTPKAWTAANTNKWNDTGRQGSAQARQRNNTMEGGPTEQAACYNPVPPGGECKELSNDKHNPS